MGQGEWGFKGDKVGVGQEAGQRGDNELNMKNDNEKNIVNKKKSGGRDSNWEQ